MSVLGNWWWPLHLGRLAKSRGKCGGLWGSGPYCITLVVEMCSDCEVTRLSLAGVSASEHIAFYIIQRKPFRIFGSHESTEANRRPRLRKRRP